jgi:hemoglobin-like flavoprotein
MNETQMALVKTTWKTLGSVDPALLGDVFYSKLFIDNPSLRSMFPKSLDEQYQKLMDMLSVLVARLERLDELKQDISKLAMRHVSYGVRPAHYKMAGAALLWTLQQGLGRDWNDEVKEAWQQFYLLISEIMINAGGYKETVRP